MSFSACLSGYVKSKTELKNLSSTVQQTFRNNPLYRPIVDYRFKLIYFYFILFIDFVTIRANRKSFTVLDRDNKKLNLGILIIIIDDFPNELLWRLWLSNSPFEVKIWFHAKYPHRVNSPWVKERLVKSFHLKPEWGSVEITKVMAYMLKEVSYFLKLDFSVVGIVTFQFA